MAELAAGMRMDLEELSSLREKTTRAAVRNILDDGIKKISATIKDLERKEAASANAASLGSAPAPPAQSSSSNSLLPTIKITNYGWDQSEKYVKMYITINGVHTAPSSAVVFEPHSSSFNVVVNDLGGKRYEFAVRDLLFDVDPKQSQVKQKADMLLVMLKKMKEGTNWDCLTKIEKQSVDRKNAKLKPEESGDPSDSIMGLMKQMYDDGDDEMKRTIRKAWHEGQQKKQLGDI